MVLSKLCFFVPTKTLSDSMNGRFMLNRYPGISLVSLEITGL